MNATVSRATVAALALVSVVLAGQLFRKSAECRRQVQSIDSLRTQATSREQALAHSNQQLDSLNARLVESASLHPLYVKELRTLGLSDPVRDLVADLRKHKELIPYPGVHGGTMGFYSPEKIRVLSRSWVYAPFDDGHIGGQAIFEYKVAPGGVISWQLVKGELGD